MAVEEIEFVVYAVLPGWTPHPTAENYQVGYLWSARFVSPLIVESSSARGVGDHAIILQGGYIEGVHRDYSPYIQRGRIIGKYLIDPIPVWFDGITSGCPNSISGQLEAKIYNAHREYSWYFLFDLVAECSIPITVHHNAYITVDLRPYLAPVTAKQSVSLGPGESVVASFNVVAYQRKTYQVTVDGLSGSFIAR